jgi:hypothetical protein
VAAEQGVLHDGYFKHIDTLSEYFEADCPVSEAQYTVKAMHYGYAVEYCSTYRRCIETELEGSR